MKSPVFHRHRAFALLSLLLLAAPVAGQEPAVQREHVVKRGDTLWDLAQQYLGNPFLWPMIYEANRNVVENPHWIYPLERLIIPPIAAPAPAVPPVPVPAPVPEAVAVAEPPAPPTDTVRAELSTVDLRRPLIPESEYYSTPWVASAPEAQLVGQIAALVDPSEAKDKIPTTLHPHYRVFLGGLRRQTAVGDSLVVVRLGRELKGWGRIVEPLALLRVDSVAPGVARATVVVQFDDARVGDRVLALETMPELPRGTAQPVAGGAEGRLLDFLVPQQLYGTGDHAFSSLGPQQVRLGDELAVYVAARREGAQSLPAVEVGRALVVKVGERTSTVRLIKVTDTALRSGLPVRLVARAP